MSVALSDIVAALGGELLGDASARIDAIAPLDGAGPSAISFLANPRYRSQLGSTRAGCVIVAPALRDEAAARGAALVTPDPYLYFARLTQWWAVRTRAALPAGVHPGAVVEEGAYIDPTARVEALAFVGAGAVVEAGTVVGAQSFVGRAARVGAGSRLAARVVLGERCTLGQRCIVHSGVVIGADGFGFAPDQGRWEKIEQLGAVRIGDDVEIGANTCIDRGALGDTVIEDGVKLDNLIQIAHNVHIGAHTAIAGCVAIAGSTRIGRHCTIAGASSVVGHIELVDHVHVSACTLVSRSIRQPGRYSGSFPFDDNASWEKNAATLRQLHALRERLKALEKKIS
ncbi:UDP-3-O-(3-hydroxymyristoyl)glucosamine N-acyltransferase [Azohydromonas caseinilytica]|uniref:UDP-3-O-acylglucosamine N-acyltransferase n=1 Tax=Azohydromonas caseinilytica TaxID=2728836 RepID=A0A848F8D5_9BURK|nr:UDP-3-O-(3-hydroxymyristoyl)glucosamine N-acyltransferase [Azohydromonas caseinilytica]NML14301.1 UDP-3-O-(3-hydroxymyristoyl)glucosamine N-acyltransferase [Azohydromonas caseinilytica]